MQKVTLVFIVVETSQQIAVLVILITAYIVAGSYKVSAEHLGVFKKGFELDLFVTENIRVGCASGFVFTEEMFKHIIPVFRSKVSGMQL